MAQLLRPGSAYYLIASLPILAVFGLIPAALYLHAGEEWSFPWTLLLRLCGLGLVGLLAVALVIRALALINARAAAVLAMVLFCFGAFLLLAHVYAPIQIGPLDGSPMTSDEPLRYTLFELAALAGLTVVLVLLLRGRGLGIAGLFTAALWLVCAGYYGVMAWTTQPDEAPAAVVAPAPAAGGNVYHFVLDTLQTDAFHAAVERFGLADQFTGFDLFENNISNYINTVPSSASYFTGTLYDSGKYKPWTRSWRGRGLFPTLRAAGYTTWMYAPFAYWRNKQIDHFWHNVALYEEKAGVAAASFYDFGQVWLASLAPNPLTNEALPLAARLRDRLFAVLAGGPNPLSIEAGVDQYASVMMLRHLLREEPARPATGQYVYAHAVLPHAPLVMDPDCRFIGKRELHRKRDPRGVREAYLAQAGCALHLVARFLDQLRALGRYDAATIVIHGDTGSQVGFFDDSVRDDGALTLGWSSYELRSQVSALLAIKPPGASGPLRVHGTPTELVDLFPTLIDLLDLPPPDYPVRGRSVYAGGGAPREARFGFDPAKRHGSQIVEVRVDDPTRPARSPLTVIGPATDPATWRDNTGTGG
jgi:hypothetical protein